jgi:hypothetical protein
MYDGNRLPAIQHCGKFRNLGEELEPRYDMPSHTTVSHSIIPEIYNNVRQKISNEIITDTGNSLKSLSFTTDMWTSKEHQSFIHSHATM